MWQMLYQKCGGIKDMFYTIILNSEEKEKSMAT